MQENIRFTLANFWRRISTVVMDQAGARSPLMCVALLGCLYGSASATVVVYPQPASLPSADIGTCTVTINGNNSPTYKTSYTGDGGGVINYTNFSSDEAVTVVVTFPSSVTSANIRPTALGIVPSSISGSSVTFTMQPKQKVSVEANGSIANACIVLGHPLEGTVPTGSNVVAYTTPGVYSIPGQTCPFNSTVNTLYLAGGVYLEAAFLCSGLTNPQILGRGIISGESQTISTPGRGMISFSGSTGIHFSGVTFANAPLDSDNSAYMVWLSGSSGDTLDDIALFNYIAPNHTGVHHLGSNSTLTNSFLNIWDDSVILTDGDHNGTYRNITFFDHGPVQFGWNQGGYGALVDGANIIHYNGANYLSTEASMGTDAFCQTSAYSIHDLILQNINVEGAINRLASLVTEKTSFCSASAADAPIYNVIFSRIKTTNTPTYTGQIFASTAAGSISNALFSDVNIAGTGVTQTNSSTYFTVGANTSNIAFEQTSNLVTNPGAEYGYLPWTSAATISVDTSTYNSGTHSLHITGRTASTNGPIQDITNQLIASGQGNYAVSFATLLSVHVDTVNFVLTLTDSAGTHTSTASCTGATTWSTCTGNVDAAWTGSLSSATVALQTSTYTDDFWADDLNLTLQDLIVNPGAENGISPWVVNNGSAAISVSNTHYHTGAHSIYTYNRTSPYYGPVQDITSQLLLGGQRTYHISVAAELSTGTDTVAATLSINDSSGGYSVEASCTVTSTAWSVCSADKAVTWTGTLSSAKLYMQTGSSTTNFWVDDMVVF